MCTWRPPWVSQAKGPAQRPSFSFQALIVSGCDRFWWLICPQWAQYLQSRHRIVQGAAKVGEAVVTCRSFPMIVCAVPQAAHRFLSEVLAETSRCCIIIRRHGRRHQIHDCHSRCCKVPSYFETSTWVFFSRVWRLKVTLCNDTVI